MELERLLQYMYYGEVKIPNAEMDAFIRAANSLSIRGLCSLSQMPLVLEQSTPEEGARGDLQQQQEELEQQRQQR